MKTHVAGVDPRGSKEDEYFMHKTMYFQHFRQKSLQKKVIFQKKNFEGGTMELWEPPYIRHYSNEYVDKFIIIRHIVNQNYLKLTILLLAREK